MNIYFNTCCYGRPFDRQEQAKIAAETMAIMTAIDTCRIAGYIIIGSEAITSEMEDIQTAKLRADIEGFYYRTINGSVPLTNSDFVRAESLRTAGLGDMDSLHLAAAEAAGVEFLLTTDEDFERICTKKKLSIVKVINPLTFLTEAIKRK